MMKPLQSRTSFSTPKSSLLDNVNIDAQRSASFTHQTGLGTARPGSGDAQDSSLSMGASPCVSGPLPTGPPSLARFSGTLPPPTIRVEAGQATQPGNRYAGLQQDFCVLQEMYTAGELPRNGQQTYIVAICDGHGILGDKSASFAGKALMRQLYASAGLRNKVLSRLAPDDIIKELKVAFKKAHAAANSIYDNPPKQVTYQANPGSQKLATYNLCSTSAGTLVYRGTGPKANEKMLECGCTCTAAVVQGNLVCLADVGDSQAVLGCDDGERYRGEIVTVRHHCLLQEEGDRIRANHSSTTRVLEDGYLAVFEGPWAGYELSVTRALGHKNMEQYGVLDDPYVTVLNIDEEKHKCLVIASDGIWDVMNGNEVVDYVMDAYNAGKTATQAADALVAHAIELGLNSPEGEQDNTSAIVLFFKQPSASAGLLMRVGGGTAPHSPLTSRPGSMDMSSVAATLSSISPRSPHHP